MPAGPHRTTSWAVGGRRGRGPAIGRPRGRGGKWGGLGKAVLPVRHTSHPNCYLIEMVAVETRPYLNTSSSTYLAFFSFFGSYLPLLLLLAVPGSMSGIDCLSNLSNITEYPLRCRSLFVRSSLLPVQVFESRLLHLAACPFFGRIFSLIFCLFFFLIEDDKHSRQTDPPPPPNHHGPPPPSRLWPSWLRRRRPRRHASGPGEHRRRRETANIDGRAGIARGTPVCIARDPSSTPSFLARSREIQGIVVVVVAQPHKGRKEQGVSHCHLCTRGACATAAEKLDRQAPEKVEARRGLVAAGHS